MTHATDSPKKSAPELPGFDLPSLSDTASQAELLSALAVSASFYWKCKNALDRVFAMTPAERQNCPGYLSVLQAARLGMSEAESVQRQARRRLEAANNLPDKWRAWPERRAVPRGPTPR